MNCFCIIIYSNIKSIFVNRNRLRTISHSIFMSCKEDVNMISAYSASSVLNRIYDTIDNNLCSERKH